MHALLWKNAEGVFPPREFHLRVYFHMFTRQNVKLVVFQVFLCSVKGKYYLILTNKTFLRWFREDHSSTQNCLSHWCVMYAGAADFSWGRITPLSQSEFSIVNRETLLNVWICATGLQHTPSYYVSFTDEASFTKGGVNNSQNMHTWSRGNPHETRVTSFQRTFLVNVWCGLLGDKLIEMFASDSNLTSDTCEFLLGIALPSLWEDILLMVGGHMNFQHDRAPLHYTWHMREYLQKPFPNLWLGHGRPLPWPARLPDLNA